MKRRIFLAGMSAGLSCPTLAHAANKPTNLITILHTNDTHSRIDPFPRGKYKGMGGISRRYTVIKQIRKSRPHSLLIDAGDIFQGTPYFNLFKGKIELETMSRMGYDFATIGNHDFDLGADWLLKVSQKHAKFPFLSANLLFSQAGADKIVRPYTVKTIGGRKIGLFGLGVRFRELVAESLHRGVKYTDPIAAAKKVVRVLREKHRCEAVILISHIGYHGFDGEPGDLDLARQVPGIDVIIGGHTHTFLYKPTKIKAPDGRITQIHQVGHSGILLGQIDLVFDARGALSVQNTVHSVAPSPR